MIFTLSNPIGTHEYYRRVGHFGHQRLLFVGGARPGTLSEESRNRPPAGSPDHSRRVKCDEVRLPQFFDFCILMKLSARFSYAPPTCHRLLRVL